MIERQLKGAKHMLFKQWHNMIRLGFKRQLYLLP